MLEIAFDSVVLFDSIILLIVAFVSNTLSALAGGGAGLIQLPALLFLGLSFQTALATHKIASVFLGLGASIAHLKSGHLTKTLTILMLAFGIPGVMLGAFTIVKIDEQLAQFLLGILTIGLGVYSIFKPKLGLTADLKNQHFFGFLLGGLGLFFLGFLNGSLTSGTGLFVTLWLVSWFGLSYKQAVAFSLVLVGIFWNASGAVTLAITTEPQYTWLPALIIGSLIGGYTGARLSQIKNNQFIKRSFEIVTILTGIALIIKVVV
ncbi:sulfite exporter TauE/SafE family protein [Marinicellulosiphila megalodicopiae]|uniref:sulfite exporter TauE/SafE family protein n=1 Tax=Marinicellulosiphila megalodicopiae TaxID=2724896 RepID=UPI003BAF9467